MSAEQKRAPAGQLANVSAVLIVDASARVTTAVRGTARLLARLIEDVVIVGGDASLREWGRRVEHSDAGDVVAGLEAAREERVLVVLASEVEQAVPAELLLGLTAWPEHDCVAPRVDGHVHPTCAVLRRDAVLRTAREEALPAAAPLDALMTRLSASAIEGYDLAALLGARMQLS